MVQMSCCVLTPPSQIPPPNCSVISLSECLKWRTRVKGLWAQWEFLVLLGNITENVSIYSGCNSFFFLMLSSGKMLVIPRQRIPNICKVKLALIRFFFFSHKLGRLCLCYSNRVNQCMDSDFLCCATHLCKHYFLWICALLIVFGRALGTAFGQDMKRCHRHRAEWNIQKLTWLFVLFSTDICLELIILILYSWILTQDVLFMVVPL